MDNKEKQKILIVDDDHGILKYLDNLLSSRQYRVSCARSGQLALKEVEQKNPPSLVILDINMPEMDGMETLMKIKETRKNIPVIMLTCAGQTQTIVKAMRLGATDYLIKDQFEHDELEVAIKNALEKKSLLDEIVRLKKELGQKGVNGDVFIAKSKKMKEIKALLDQVVDTDVTILLQGESGVGKEVITNYIISHSIRRDKPFIKVNCAALPEELLESELFGYEKGAFTGANSQKPGKFEVANKGTIFLDEIGEMNLSLQAKLLQVLQDSQFSRLGGRRDIGVDVRVIVATNKHLEKAVEKGEFRKDLYYRLNVVNIIIPPLRERRDEIRALADYFLDKYKKRYNRKRIHIPDEVYDFFQEYEWPGNVRELENLIKRFVVLDGGENALREIYALRNLSAQESFSLGSSEKGHSSLKEISRKAAIIAEKKIITKVLNQTNWNRKETAKKLNISYKALLYKIKECGVMEH